MKTLIRNLKFVAMAAVAFCAFGALSAVVGTTSAEMSAKAVYDSSALSLTFYYDAIDHSSQGTVYQFAGSKIEAATGCEDIPWTADSNIGETMTNVTFDASFANYAPKGTAFWFYNFTSLERIAGIGNLDTSSVTNMSYMFYACDALTELDVSGFDTANVTSMAGMFGNCQTLTDLDVSGFKTANVMNMADMFYRCKKLTKLDLSGFDTANVTSMACMFEESYALTELDLSSFDTANVLSMKKMVSACKGLTNLNLFSFNTANVTDMANMFCACSAVKTIVVLESFNTDSVTESDNMFNYCTSLVGGNGTMYDSERTDKTYARIDGEMSLPGYFSLPPTEPIFATPIAVANADVAVYTNGFPSAESEAGKWHAWSNRTAYVVYTAKPGYVFEGGVTELTIKLNTMVNPAVNKGGAVPVVLPPVEYLAPVYKGTDGNPANGIACWITNRVAVTDVTFVTNAASQVTWGTAGATNWFAVTNNVQIDGGVVCKGFVNLILCEGAKLVVTNSTGASAGIMPDESGLFTIYGQPDGAGELAAFGGSGAAGIGCRSYRGETGKNITINGGTVTAIGSNTGGAGIGGGSGSGAENITINAGTVTAIGSDSAGAGIGSCGWGTKGSTNITINGGTVIANGGFFAAGIGGGGSGSDSSYITINAGTVTAIGGDYGAGIGGGTGSAGSNISISGGEVTAIGGALAASIGGGSGGVGSNITISNVVVFAQAIPGFCVPFSIEDPESKLVIPDVIGNGDNDTTPASNIVIDASAKVFFNLTGFWDANNSIWLEEPAPMPATFDGFVIMMPATQTVDRVLVSGLQAPSIFSTPSTLQMTNAVSGATADIVVGGDEVVFAGAFCGLSLEDGVLSLSARPPALNITQQPNRTNDFEVVASAESPYGIVNYTWLKKVNQEVGFTTLTNSAARVYGVYGNDSTVASENYTGVLLTWNAGDIPPNGCFYFTCCTGTIRQVDWCGKLVQTGDDAWKFEPKENFGKLSFAVYNEVPGNFTISNLTWVVLAEPVVEGADVKMLPAEVGETGEDYLCRLTAAHDIYSYTADTLVFTYVAPPVEVTPTEIDHTDFKVFLGGNPVEKTGGKYIVPSNSMVTVVYVVNDEDYCFADGKPWKSAQFKADGTPGTPESVLPAEPVLYWMASKEINFDLREHKVILDPEEMLPIAYSTNNWQDDKVGSLVVVNVTNANTGAGVEIVATNENGYADWMPLAGAYGRYNFLAIGEDEVTNLFGYVYYTANVELITNGLDVAGTSFKVYVGENEVLPDENGKYIVETNSQVVVKYEITEDGIYFDDGTKKWQSAPLPADLSINNLAEIGGKVPAGHEPKAPGVWLGRVGQRYPWNGIVDVNYQIRNWPGTDGYVAKLVVTVGETCVTNEIDCAGMTGIASGIEPVDLNAIAGEQKAKAKFSVFVQQLEE